MLHRTYHGAQDVLPCWLTVHFQTRESQQMDMSNLLTPLVSLIAGILIFIYPRLLSKIVAIYLIAVGIIGLLGAANIQF